MRKGAAHSRTACNKMWYYVPPRVLPQDRQGSCQHLPIVCILSSCHKQCLQFWLDNLDTTQHNNIPPRAALGITCFSRLVNAALLLGTTGCYPNFSAPRTPKVHPWFTGSAGQGNLPTAAKWFNLVGSSLQ
jgi:hypothetical protein